METKKFISTVKGFRTRFTNKPNVELEKKSIESMCEKMGGKLEVMAQLKENNELELLTYVRKILGIVRVEEETKKVEVPQEPKTNKVKKSEEVEVLETATGKDGKLYEIDTVKKTCRRVFKDLSDLSDLELPEMSMVVYQRYLRDNFEGESAPIKKGKLYFRGYRISCDTENGFMIEDSTKRYSIVETTGFEGIPTPKELGEFFKRPRVEHTPEELAEAVERGKELARKAKEEKEREIKVEEEIDFEVFRKKVIGTIIGIREKKIINFDPMTFSDMIPFRRWKRNVNALLKAWKSRKLRYGKLLDQIEVLTEEETFEIAEKNHRSSFTGTVLPEFSSVGMLVGDKLEVDGKQVEAVPFLLDYILHYEPKAMQQIMRYAKGEITDVFLLKNPFHNDWKIEYKKRDVPNTAHTAQVLTALCESVGLVAPQDLLYNADLKIGDRILIAIDGEWKSKQIMQVEKGICMNREVGLLKLDKWIKIPAADE